MRRPGVAMTISQPIRSLKPCSSRDKPPMTETVRNPSGVAETKNVQVGPKIVCQNIYLADP